MASNAAQAQLQHEFLECIDAPLNASQLSADITPLQQQQSPQRKFSSASVALASKLALAEERIQKLSHEHQLEKNRRLQLEMQLHQTRLNIDDVVEHHMSKVKAFYETRISHLEKEIERIRRRFQQQGSPTALDGNFYEDGLLPLGSYGAFNYGNLSRAPSPTLFGSGATSSWRRTPQQPYQSQYPTIPLMTGSPQRGSLAAADVAFAQEQMSRSPPYRGGNPTHSSYRGGDYFEDVVHRLRRTEQQLGDRRSFSPHTY